MERVEGSIIEGSRRQQLAHSVGERLNAWVSSLEPLPWVRKGEEVVPKFDTRGK